MHKKHYYQPVVADDPMSKRPRQDPPENVFASPFSINNGNPHNMDQFRAAVAEQQQDPELKRLTDKNTQYQIELAALKTDNHKLRAENARLQNQAAGNRPAIPPFLSIIELKEPWIFDSFEVTTGESVYVGKLDDKDITDGALLIPIISLRQKAGSITTSIIVRNEDDDETLNML